MYFTVALECDLGFTEKCITTALTASHGKTKKTFTYILLEHYIWETEWQDML